MYSLFLSHSLSLSLSLSLFPSLLKKYSLVLFTQEIIFVIIFIMDSPEVLLIYKKRNLYI